MVQRVGHADPVRMTVELGIAVRYCSLEAEEGELETAVAPDQGAPFEILCDPWIPPEKRDRLRLWVADELPRTFSYGWPRVCRTSFDHLPPRRKVIATHARRRWPATKRGDHPALLTGDGPRPAKGLWRRLDARRDPVFGGASWN